MKPLLNSIFFRQIPRMFSGITSYIWGAAPAAPEAEVLVPAPQPLAADAETTQLSEPSDVVAMDVVSVGSDEDIFTPPQCTSDDDEWVVISDDDEPAVITKSFKSASTLRQLQMKGDISISEII